MALRTFFEQQWWTGAHLLVEIDYDDSSGRQWIDVDEPAVTNWDLLTRHPIPPSTGRTDDPSYWEAVGDVAIDESECVFNWVRITVSGGTVVGELYRGGSRNPWRTGTFDPKEDLGNGPGVYVFTSGGPVRTIGDISRYSFRPVVR